LGKESGFFIIRHTGGGRRREGEGDGHRVSLQTEKTKGGSFLQGGRREGRSISPRPGKGGDKVPVWVAPKRRKVLKAALATPLTPNRRREKERESSRS